MLEGIEAVHGARWPKLKIDTVVIRGVNDDELVALIEYGRRVDGEVRFIEYMDVGGATAWSMSRVVSRAEMLRALERHYGRIEPIVGGELGSRRPLPDFPMARPSVSSRPRRARSAARVTGAG